MTLNDLIQEGKARHTELFEEYGESAHNEAHAEAARILDGYFYGEDWERALRQLTRQFGAELAHHAISSERCKRGLSAS